MGKLIFQLFVVLILLVVIINLISNYWPIIFVLLVLVIIAKIFIDRNR